MNFLSPKPNYFLLAVSILLVVSAYFYYSSKTGMIKSRAQEVVTSNPSVELRENKLYVDGQYIFPIGLWGVPKDTVFANSTNKLPLTALELKAAGFNLLMPYNPIKSSTEQEIETPGLYRLVFIRQADGLNLECQATPTDITQDTCRIRKIIRSNLNRTDVIGWFGADEPGVIKTNQPQPISPDALKAGYDIAKATDPLKRPVWIDQANIGVPPPSYNCDLSSLLPYNKALDIYSTFAYPIPAQSIISNCWKNLNLALVGEVATKHSTIANADKKRPFWFFLQGSDKNSWGTSDCTGCDQKPTKEEERFMAYNALIHGADGIFWFGVWALPTDDPTLKGILDVAKEINDNKNILTADVSTLDVKVTVTKNILDAEGKSALHYMVKHYGSKDYIIVANNVAQGIEVVFKVPATGVARYPSGEKITTSNNSFKEKIEPFGVRIFEVTPK